MKVFKKLLTFILALGLNATLLFGYRDCLNVPDDLVAEMTMEEVFNNTSYTRQFHRYIYTDIPGMSNIIITDTYASLTGSGNPWSAASGELKSAQNDVKTIPAVGYYTGSVNLSRWSLCKQVWRANGLIAYAHVVPRNGDVADFIDEEELALLRNEAHFLHAYYHYLLFELYGPIPIMAEITDLSVADLDYYRNSVDEVVAFIDKELNECHDLLPEKELNPDGTINNEHATTPTRGATLAILAKLCVYTAGPLFSGGYPEAVALEDNQGKQLFPAKDDTKWKTALDAPQRPISYSKGHCSLYQVIESGEIDLAESLYQLFQVSANDSETVWQNSKNSWGGVSGEDRERRCTPRAIFSGFSRVGVLQEAIDDFLMSDGKSIEESGLYKEESVGEDGIPNMCKSREPRLYQDITYSDKVWQRTGKKICFYKGMPDDNSKADMSYSGYLLYKGINRNLLNRSNNLKSKYRAGMLFRLGDFYLLCAGVLDHVNPDDARIIQYMDSIRYRAGIPLLKDIKPEIISNRELQEKAIHHERRIELSAEGQRYFGVHRWMCAEEKRYKRGGLVHGIDINTTNFKGFVKRTVFEIRIFEKRMYLYPIPLARIQEPKRLVQNPGW